VEKNIGVTKQRKKNIAQKNVTGLFKEIPKKERKAIYGKVAKQKKINF